MTEQLSKPERNEEKVVLGRHLLTDDKGTLQAMAEIEGITVDAFVAS